MEIGSLAAWVSAALTGGGLLAAVYQLRLGRQEAQTARQREYDDEVARQEAMAQAVGVTAEWRPGPDGRPPKRGNGRIPVDVTILNASPYPISGSVLLLAADDLPRQIVYGTILPGQTITDTHESERLEVVFGELTGGATLLFTDVYGNHWARTPHSLERRDLAARIC